MWLNNVLVNLGIWEGLRLFGENDVFKALNKVKVTLDKKYEIACSNFFNELALKNWAMNMHFNPLPIH